MAAFVYPGLVGLMLLAQVGGVSTQGISVSASDTDGHAFWMTGLDPTADEWQPTLGSVSLEAEDRVQLPGATYGDRATVQAEVRDGGDTWTVELTQPGFPPAPSGEPSALRSGLPFSLFGGVLTNADLQGFTGLGLLRGPQVHAAAVVWGEGTVLLNGQVVTEHALIEVDALSSAGHADDQSFRTLRNAREGDAEIVVFATRLPTAQVPRGFLLFGFDDVRISIGGQAVASQRVVPSTGAEGPGAPSGPVNAASPLPMSGVGGSGSGIGAPSSSAGGEFSSPGIPASPPVLNNGTNVTPTPETPPPLNAAPATPLPQTPAPANATPASPAAPATPAPATGTPATAPGG